MVQVPPSVRGLLISLKEGVIVLGVLAGYVAGALLADEVGFYALMCSYCCLVRNLCAPSSAATRQLLQDLACCVPSGFCCLSGHVPDDTLS